MATVLTPTSDDAFPLRLTPFERMMLAEDRAHYPMTAVVELKFIGSLNGVAFEQAYETAISRHPLLRAHVEKRRFRAPVWVSAAAPRIRWLSEGADHDVPAIELTNGAGLRLEVSGSIDPKISISVHHACCDGSGILAFVQDLLLGYHLCVTNADVEKLPPVDAKQLPFRNDFPLTSQSLSQRIGRTAFGIREAAKFTLRKVAPLATKNKQKEDATSHRYLAVESESALLRGLRKRAAREGVTLNDLLLRDFLATLGNWQRDHQGSPRGRFRLLVPCDLRTPDHAQTPAANILGYAFLTREIAECAATPELLTSVRDEMAFIRDTNASLYFLRCLQVASWLPGGVAGIGRARGCFSTSLLSNIGDPGKYFPRALPRDRGRLVAGGLTLLSLIAYPPLRPDTRAGVVLSTYNNQLSCGLHFDSSCFSSEAAIEFANYFLTTLADSAAAN